MCWCRYCLQQYNDLFPASALWSSSRQRASWALLQQVRHCLGISASYKLTTKYPDYPFRFPASVSIISVWNIIHSTHYDFVSFYSSNSCKHLSISHFFNPAAMMSMFLFSCGWINLFFLKKKSLQSDLLRIQSCICHLQYCVMSLTFRGQHALSIFAINEPIL